MRQEGEGRNSIREGGEDSVGKEKRGEGKEMEKRSGAGYGQVG
jgi:hypothetical protein